MIGEFESRDTAVVAISQEDTDLKSHANMLKKIPAGLKYDVVADLNRMDTSRYRRTTVYLIDKKGIVRQIFPMTIHHRAAWRAVLSEIDEMIAR